METPDTQYDEIVALVNEVVLLEDFEGKRRFWQQVG